MTAMPTYFKIDGVDRLFFRCATLRSTLSREACAENFRCAQTLAEEHVSCRHLCRRCPIGAATAGAKLIHESKFRGASVCPRCRKFAGRMIGGTKCIGCYNREREIRVGKNAKGTKPTRTLRARRLGVIVNYGEPGARYLELHAPYSGDTIELGLAVLRVASGRIALHRALGRPAVPVADFVREMDPPAPARGVAAVQRSEMFRRSPPAQAAPAPALRPPRSRLPAIDRWPNEARCLTGGLDPHTVRERLLARTAP